MGRRKAFVRSDLLTATVEHARDPSTGTVVLFPDRIPPADSVVRFPDNPAMARAFDFGKWYGLGIDQITYVCQKQIERFADRQDSDVEPYTTVGYCRGGLRQFLNFAAMLAAALSRPLQLGDIGRPMMDSYLSFLADTGMTLQSQRVAYYYTKSVLGALGRRGLITVVDTGDDATFPKNAYSNSHRVEVGEKPLSPAEKKAFTLAIKSAVQPMFAPDATPPCRQLLSHALLVIALHTGRNTTPLIEMPIDCLRPHPKDATEFLVLYKRRGHTTSKVALRSESGVERVVESLPTVRPTVARLIRRVIELTNPLRDAAPAALRNRVWIYRNGNGQVTPLYGKRLADDIAALVKQFELRDEDGIPLRINVSRLRKTFVNRIHEILDGDLAATAAAAGNQPRITEHYYLRPGSEARKNWRFMGICLVKELKTGTLGATERTPLGRCSDNKAGEYAPKHDGAVCQSFMNCLRCRNYVVTGDDLWRLFSFYWCVLKERARIGKARWQKHLAHIPRLIDRDVVSSGLARKAFSKAQVDAARDRARRDPHPFWASQTIISDLENLA
ncbi:MAG: hypothetical protein ABI821_06590 [Pseudomonadota bacterium]